MKKLKETINQLELVRVEKKLSYDDVAKMINASKSTIWKIFTGLNSPNSETLLLLIDALGFDFNLIKKNILLKDIPKENTLLKGKWMEESGQIDKKKLDAILKRRAKSMPRSTLGNGNYNETLKMVQEKEKLEVLNNCPDCKYAETASGIVIKTLKCNKCKTLKK